MTDHEGILSPRRLSSALRFWEPMRIVFNVVLAVAFFALGGGTLLGEGGLLTGAALVVLAAGANILYCLAYPIDLLTQNSDWREGWLRWGRPLLFCLGTLTAVAIEFLMLFGMTAPFP